MQLNRVFPEPIIHDILTSITIQNAPQKVAEIEK
jgi:hypothetical protein